MVGRNRSSRVFIGPTDGGATARAASEREMIVKYVGCRPEAVLDAHGSAGDQELGLNIAAAATYAVAGAMESLRPRFEAAMAAMAPSAAAERARKHRRRADAAAPARADEENEEREREAFASGLAVMLRLKKVTPLKTREAMSAHSGWEAMTRQENMLERARQYVGLYVETAREMNRQ